MALMTKSFQSLGPPDIELAGLQLWVHDRAFPDHDDFWDGNWLQMTAHCGEQDADVWVSGAILHLSEFRGWYEALVKLNQTLTGEAKLGGVLEKNLNIELTIDKLGHIKVMVKITPNLMNQRHSFKFYIDQTYLNSLLVQCRSVLTEYPIRGKQPEPR